MLSDYLSDYVITVPEGKEENQVVLKKTLLSELLKAWFITEGLDTEVPLWVLDGEITDIRIDCDMVTVVYEEEGVNG